MRERSKEGAITHHTKTNIIKELRSLCPDRPLDDLEARSVAERQALRLLRLTDTHEPQVPSEIITELPRLYVQRTHGLPSSGATMWSRGRWVIQLKAEDHPLRRRFSLAHELKHIIDHPFIDKVYEPQPLFSSGERAETICDYFAACLLMPRPWIKTAWAHGIQRPAELTRLFGVSGAAMNYRLNQLGLVAPTDRCGTSYGRSRRRSFRPRYFRSRATPAPVGVIG